MATIATCPQCAAQLALPETVAADSRGQCPQCDAEFSLDELIQVSLAPVRILEAPSAATEPPAFGAGIVDESDARQTLADWEERLKKAIDATAKTATDETTVNGPTNGPTDLDFEVELDAPPASEEHQSPTVDDGSTPGAATVNISEDATVEQYSTLSEEPADENNAPEPVFEPSGMLDLGEPTAGDFAIPALDDSPAIGLDTLPRRPAKKRLLPKLAAMLLFGPVLGGVAGLYGLLWIKGPSADFLGLAKYLPPTLLPPSMLASDAGPAESPPVRTDGDVQPATAEQEVASPPTTIALSDFAPLVTAARAAASDLTTGDLLTRESKSRKGQAYITLCRLAEDFEFVSQHADDPAARNQIAVAKQLYRQITASQAGLADLSQIATLWWEHPGRQNSGIFFAGQIRAARPIGAGTLCQIVLDEQLDGRPITVLFRRTTYQISDQVGVVGAVVTDPQSEIPAYDSSESQVVVAYDSYRTQ